MNTSITSVFISHGGGPLPLLGHEGHSEMIDCLKDIAKKLPRPDAIIVVSAHWEASIAKITAAASPELIYDYSGFPPESYQIEYPCSGQPELAQEMFDVFNNASIHAELDQQRGFDHGLFVPLKLMYPAADIPCVQLSLLNNLDPASHIAIGKALKTLNFDNVLVIGSGFSFHNMRAFFSADTPESIAQNEAFEAWLHETCSSTSLTEQQRTERLINWSEAPAARYCHPREEHLLALHVCYGIAERACTESFSLNVLGKKSSMYIW